MISRFNRHHRRAIIVLAAAVILDVIFGIAYGIANHTGIGDGLYYATGVATTSGNSPALPVGWLPHVLTVLMMATIIPLFAAAFSLVTTGLTANHIDTRHEELKAHVTGITSTASDGNE